MKKLIAAFVFIVAFSLNANAQANASELAKNDVVALSGVVQLSEQNKASFLDIFKQKHEAFAKETSENKKKIIAKSVDAKLRGILSAEQMAKLDKNPELLKKLTQN